LIAEFGFPDKTEVRSSHSAKRVNDPTEEHHTQDAPAVLRILGTFCVSVGIFEL
jgi:hypothetical protein